MTNDAADGLRSRWLEIVERVTHAAQRTSRKPGDITIVAVTKTFPAEAVRSAMAAGARVFGENRIQEAAEKIPSVEPRPEWHLIGHLQTNKVKAALELFDVIQSVDSLRLAKAIGAEAAATGKTARVLLEVNVSGESQKYGFDPAGIYAAADEITEMRSVQVEGLMGIAPLEGGESAARASFKNLRNIFGALKSAKNPALKMKTLSMGMSGDYAAAIEEGSNMIRVGRALFGEC